MAGDKDKNGVFQEKGLIVNEYGDGVAWFRGSMIGKGGFGCVYLATLKNPRSKYSYYPSVMAVKSAEVSVSGSIQKEREVLSNIKGCPDIIKCFGEETTMGDNGAMVYNLLLEYGSGGTLAERIKKSGLSEFEVKVHTRSILRGLNHVHRMGYVHCDLKPENILLVLDSRNKGGSDRFRVKIGDFGLAKRAKQSKKRKLEPYWRGTPMYLSPEAVVDNVQESPCDVWALGCIVLEMLTRKPPFGGSKESNAEEILERIRTGREFPKIPSGVSKEAKDFLKGCFARNPVYRLTAEMLLNHRFLEGLEEEDGVEELEEVEDLNEFGSFLVVCESDDGEDDEVSCGSYSDDDEDSFYYWSEDEEEDEDDDDVEEDEITCSISGESEFKGEEIKGAVVGSTINTPGFNQSNEKPRPIPVSLPIRAGV